MSNDLGVKTGEGGREEGGEEAREDGSEGVRRGVSLSNNLIIQDVMIPIGIFVYLKKHVD